MDGGRETAVTGGEMSGGQLEMGEEQRVLEDDKLLSTESVGDGDRDRGRSLISVLREGIVVCLLPVVHVNCCEDHTL